MRKKLSLLALLAALFLLVNPSPLTAQGLSPDVQQAENYLRNMNTATARFLQTAADGSQLIGTFYLDRPGKLRFEYDEPIKDFIVADGFFIYFYDSQLGEQTNAPIGQTLADFLLRRDLKLSGDITVTDVERSANDLLLISLAQSEDPMAGTLILGFETQPFRLKKWRVIDATGGITEIELFKLQTDIELDNDLFVYVDPKRGQFPSYND